MDNSLSLNGFGDKPLIPIADIKDGSKYSKEEIEGRNKLACLYRLVDFFHWSQGIYNHISLRLPGTGKHEILINPLGLLYREVTASSLVKITTDGRIIDHGSTPLGINQAGYILHTAIHEAFPEITCVLHVHTSYGAAVASMECGLLPINQEAMIIGPVAYINFTGMLSVEEEKAEIAKQLQGKKVIFLRNHGFACCGTSVEEALHLAYHALNACKAQVCAMSAGLDKIILSNKESIEKTYELAKHGANGMNRTAADKNGTDKMVHTLERMGDIEWGVGELEWEAWMRQMDGAGYKTGYKYKMPQLMDVINKVSK
jgi:adducin